ncbi:MAG: ABC transporter permease, partial [Acidimicrobiales bacterium]|nr:ABC transporter permease [Acidimicrobiales bacterium]
MLNNLLPAGSRARSLALGALAFVASAILVQFALPGTPGGGRGTPMAILFVGLVNGCGLAVTAVGLVLVYRSLRVINFAQAALGAAGGRLFFEFLQFTEVPFPIALVLGVAVGALVGVAFDLIFGRKFFNAPRIMLTVITIAALPFLAFFIAGAVPSLPIFPRTGARSLLEQFGGVPSRPFLPFPGWEFKIGDFNNTYGFAEVLNIEILVFVLIGVTCFLRYTRSGVAIRALAENSERASLLGIPVGNLSTIVWGIAGALSALTVIGLGALTTPAAASGAGAAVPILLAPMVAAVIARFQSIPIAVASSLLFAIVANAVNYSFPDKTGIVQFAYFAILVSVLLFQRRGAGRSEEGTGVSWSAVKEQRSIPKELAKIGTVRNTRWALIAAAAVFVVVFPLVVPSRFQFLGSSILLQAIVGVSLVVLTGWAGQISLGQFAFSAVGAVVASSLTSRFGWPFWLAVPVATTVAGAFAALVGLPALRIKGLFLAVVTMALTITVDVTLFNEDYFGWLLPTGVVDRPSLFFLDFEKDRSMYYLSAVCLALSIIVVMNLRRSRFGRLLIAMRENEANVQSFGVSAVRLKISAFAVSGALAGFAGAVFVHQQRGLSGRSFDTQHSLDVFVFTVLGGIGSVGGAMLGSIYQNLIQYFLPSNDFFAAILSAFQQGGSTLLVLFIAP